MRIYNKTKKRSYQMLFGVIIIMLFKFEIKERRTLAENAARFQSNE